MRKTDKKVNNKIIKTLTGVCDTALNQFVGFQWLTHLVDYSAFPKSLRVICVFDSDEHLNDFLKSHNRPQFDSLIQQQLQKINIDIDCRHISYTTEASYRKNSSGK